MYIQKGPFHDFIILPEVQHSVSTYLKEKDTMNCKFSKSMLCTIIAYKT